MVSNTQIKWFWGIQIMACFYISYLYSYNNGIIGGEKGFEKEKFGKRLNPSMEILKKIESEFPNLPVQNLLQQNRHKRLIKL